MPLLGTKLHLPSPRRALVARERLVNRLRTSTAPKLVLVSAPAGFGKTTLMVQWLAATNVERVVWLSLDATDDEPHRFLTHLVAAVRAAIPEVGEEAEQLLETGPEPALASLVNELDTLPGRTVIALDDYHVLDAQAVHAAVLCDAVTASATAPPPSNCSSEPTSSWCPSTTSASGIAITDCSPMPS